MASKDHGNITLIRGSNDFRVSVDAIDVSGFDTHDAPNTFQLKDIQGALV